MPFTWQVLRSQNNASESNRGYFFTVGFSRNIIYLATFNCESDYLNQRQHEKIIAVLPKLLFEATARYNVQRGFLCRTCGHKTKVTAYVMQMFCFQFIYWPLWLSESWHCFAANWNLVYLIVISDELEFWFWDGKKVQQFSVTETVGVRVTSHTLQSFMISFDHVQQKTLLEHSQ